MARRGSSKGGRRRQQGAPFLENGIRLLIMAGGLWIVTLFLASNPVLGPMVSGLRSILWVPALIGSALLVVHVMHKKARDSKNSSSDSSPGAPSQEPFAEAPVAIPNRRDKTTDSAHPTRRDPVFATALDQPTTSTRTNPADTGNMPGKSATWTPEVFAAIEWRRFEAVVEALFAQAGFETRSQSHGADGGVDIWLHSKNAEGPVSVVQCKHWQGKPVGVKEMREFFGVMASHGLKRGTYATTSHFTADSLAFAKANGIHAQDGASLLKLIAQRTPEQQERLLAVAYEGEYWKPTCASCGIKMTERTSVKDGNRFWGCVNYPRCKRTLPMKSA